MKKLVSGIQPTGVPTLGNYLGAIKNFVKLSKEYKSFIFIADLHSITQEQSSAELRNNIYNLAAMYISCGLNHENSNLFVQSRNPNHSELGWIMITQTGIGELNRMTQFKDKKNKFNDAHIPAGLLTYPSLQAADILLYDPKVVPVGSDQKQHLELTKTLAQRMNSRYGLNINIPEAVIPEKSRKIMSLQDPTKKMSKSDEKKLATIFLNDSYNEIEKKIKKSVTDSEGRVYFDIENKPGISNLMNIISSINGLSYNEIEEKFKDKNYGEFKKYATDVIWEEISPIQEKYFMLLDNKELIDEILDSGLSNAKVESEKRMNEIKISMGLL